MKTLIFGASGTFGTAIDRLCLERGHNVLPLSSKHIDVTDELAVKKIFQDFRPNLVINSVALVGINPCEEFPERAFAINTTAARIIASLSADMDAILVQPSTHAVFNGQNMQPYTESDHPDPGNIYAISKYGAECLAKYHAPKHYVVRFPTLFGERRNANFGFCDKVVMWIKSGKELRIATDKIDSPTYTRDAAERILYLVENDCSYGTYHIANTGVVSYYSLACKIAEIMNYSTSNIIPALDAEFSSPAFKPLRTALTSIKLPPMRNWEDALRDHICGVFEE